MTQKILVMGLSGAGKTTLSEQLDLFVFSYIYKLKPNCIRL